MYYRIFQNINYKTSLIFFKLEHARKADSLKREKLLYYKIKPITLFNRPYCQKNWQCYSGRVVDDMITKWGIYHLNWHIHLGVQHLYVGKLKWLCYLTVLAKWK